MITHEEVKEEVDEVRGERIERSALTPTNVVLDLAIIEKELKKKGYNERATNQYLYELINCAEKEIYVEIMGYKPYADMITITFNDGTILEL